MNEILFRTFIVLYIVYRMFSIGFFIKIKVFFYSLLLYIQSVSHGYNKSISWDNIILYMGGLIKAATQWWHLNIEIIY